MARVVTNKYISTNRVTSDDFFEGINLANDSCQDMLDIARGRIIISNEPGHEAIFVLSNDGKRAIMVAQNPESEIPISVINYLNEKFEEFENEVINSGDTIYNTLIGYISEISASTEESISAIERFVDGKITEITNNVESSINDISGTVENKLSEYDEEMRQNFDEQNSRIDALSSYTMNLKFSDHFMLTEDEYFELTNKYGDGSFKLTNETPTYKLNGLKIGDVVYYNPDMYYCIYELDGDYEDDEQESGGWFDPDTNTIVINGIVDSGSYIMINGGVTYDSTNGYLIFDEKSDGGYSDDESFDEIDDKGNVPLYGSLSDDGEYFVFNNISVEEGYFVNSANDYETNNPVYDGEGIILENIDENNNVMAFANAYVNDNNELIIG